MKRVKSEHPFVRRSSFSYILLGAAALYLILLFFKFPDFLDSISDNGLNGFSFGDYESGRTSKSHVSSLYSDENRRMRGNENEHAYLAPRNNGMEEIRNDSSYKKSPNENYGRITGKVLRRMNRTKNMSLLEIMEEDAWTLGLKAWEALRKYDEKEISMSNVLEKNPESCPSGISMNGEELAQRGDLLVLLPCGLAAGSSITITGTPRQAHKEYARKIVKTGDSDGLVSVSQFVVELQGLKSVDGEDPPKILHLNPRLSGDWSCQPVIEHNTCYRMQWGMAQRCNGLPSKKDDMLVDGNLRCEKWTHNDILGAKESKMLSWFDRFIGRPKKPDVTWPFPFRERRMFILTVNAGVEGFHINVGGRHVTSFPYRTGFTLEDATGLAIKGDLDVHSVYATSLPSSHPSFSLNRVLEFSEKWKSHFSPQGHVRLFIGVLSASNHFSERMAVRKTWMQSLSVKSSNVAVRFFVALNPRTEANAVLRKEAAYFGDIEILQFMDRYDLVVLKTIAICEYGVQNLRAEYIMKCDDDTFVRVETILKAIEGFSPRSSLYLGNLNLWHRPLRTGKWAVSYEEWLEEIYPPYANGPGYVITSDIANYIISQRANHTLRIFKMEDVSMGMWVEKFNATTKRVTYSHNWKFCQYGCIKDYYTAHYQSPRQMICLWDNLMKGQASCCNF